VERGGASIGCEMGRAAWRVSCAGLAAALVWPAALAADVRAVRILQQGSDFAGGRLASGLSLRAAGLGVSEAGSTYQSAPLDAGLTFAAVGPHWQASAGLRVFLELRVSRDGIRWGRWIPVPEDDVIAATGEDGRPQPFAADALGALVFVDPQSRFVQYRVELQPTAPASGELRRVGLHLIDPGRGPRREGRARVAEDEPPFVLPGVPKPTVSLRAEWGARPPKYEYTLTLANHLAIHHTATVEDWSAETWDDCAARMRAMQAFHMDTRGWNDIGYNYTVCRHGHVFQAREDDDDLTDVHGAHDGWNRTSAGISCLGYFHAPYDHQPTEEMLTALTGLLAWIADRRAIDPLGAGLYEPFGAIVDNIYGHREVAATACPGDILFALKEPIRVGVAETIARYRTAPPQQ
jgi:hypothetical protein